MRTAVLCLCLPLAVESHAQLATTEIAESKNATFTTFDAPGAGSGFNQGTVAFGVNTTAAITGSYADSSTVFHGFVRSTNGTITAFDAPGAGSGNSQGTYANSINPAGTIAGYYLDAGNVIHGFVRSTNGTITAFDAPGAGSGNSQGT